MQVYQTDAGGQVQAFGRQLTAITISGVTGWGQMANPNGGVIDGFTFWQQFKALIDNFITTSATDAANSWELYLYNWSDDAAWSVYPQPPYTLDRTPQLPLYYSYSFSFIALSPIPPVKDSTGAVVGSTPDPIRQTVPSPNNPQALGGQLATIRTQLLTDCALCKDLIVLGNVGILSSSEQALVAANPIYQYVSATQTLTGANFPGIGAFTGYGVTPQPPASVLGVIDQDIMPVTTAIGLAVTNQVGTIPAPYGDVLAAQAGLESLQAALQAQYGASPPSWLMQYLAALSVDLGPLVGQSVWFQS